MFIYVASDTPELEYRVGGRRAEGSQHDHRLADGKDAAVTGLV